MSVRRPLGIGMLLGSVLLGVGREGSAQPTGRDLLLVYDGSGLIRFNEGTRQYAPGIPLPLGLYSPVDVEMDLDNDHWLVFCQRGVARVSRAGVVSTALGLVSPAWSTIGRGMVDSSGDYLMQVWMTDGSGPVLRVARDGSSVTTVVPYAAPSPGTHTSWARISLVVGVTIR